VTSLPADAGNSHRDTDRGETTGPPSSRGCGEQRQHLGDYSIRDGHRPVPLTTGHLFPAACLFDKGIAILTDDLWLTAHDTRNGRPRIRDWPLGIGLATGLFAELGHVGYLDLRQGELFRVSSGRPDDPALRSLLAQMEEEEQSWPLPSPPPYSPPAQDGCALRRPVPDKHRHRQRGHDLRTWLSYLTYQRRAEARVVGRLTRAGLVKQEQRRRFFGDTTARHSPCNSVIAGLPAAVVNDAVRSGQALSRSGLFLVGLFLATGLDVHAHAALAPAERSRLANRLQDLDSMSRELLQAADVAIGEATMRPRRRTWRHPPEHRRRDLDVDE
jgi:hypothetical protein